MSQNPDEGTDLTIQEAVDNLPAQGGTIFVKNGTYSITAPILLPDKNVNFVVAAGAVIAPVGSIALFSVPDGLTDVRTYQIMGAPTLQGDPGSNQTVFQLDDANGYGNFELCNAKVTGFATFVDWLQYGTYSRQTNVWVYDSFVEAIVGDSFLAKTSSPAGTFNSAAAIRVDNCLFAYKFSGGHRHVWKGNADVDLWFEESDTLSLKQGSAFNGIMLSGMYLGVYDAGDVTFYGNGWDAWDTIQNGSAIFGLSSITLTGSAARIIFFSGILTLDFAWSSNGAVKCIGVATVRIGQMVDTLGAPNPAIELVKDSSSAHHTQFFSGWPQGCVKISGKSYCKVHDNDFDVAGAVTGKAVIETAGSDKNIIHNNTHYGINGGATIVGAGTIQPDNIN